MSFFKSVFSDDPNPSPSESNNAPHRESPNAPISPSAAWKNLGSLIKTLSEKSETVVDIYRRDLHEFGTGLKKEIEVAHGSLETVGHVIDRFGNTVIKGTAQIISHGKDVILDSDSDSDNSNNNNKNKKQSGSNSKVYCRFDSQVRAIQGDPKTFTEEPFDLERYNKWKLEFSLEGKNDEMEGLLKENEAMESVYKRVVPNVVDSETFWLRYYYKLYKVKKAEDVRARLVRRMKKEEEEELSWDVDDDDEHDEDDDDDEHDEDDDDGDEHDDDDDDDNDEKNGREGGEDFKMKDGVVEIKRLDDSDEEVSKVEKRNSLSENKMKEESKVDENLEAVQEKSDGGQADDVKDSVVDSDKRMTVESKVGDGKSSPVVSKDKEREEVEEKDLEWDEIEELGRIDDKKAMGSGSPSKIDIRKRLSSAAEEDLSWDIEDDDDELTKA